MTVALILSLVSFPAVAQSGNDTSAWRALAEQLEGAVAIDMRLRDGQHFKATFIAAHADSMLVQRRTRVPVAVEEIEYDTVASVARVQPSNLSAGKIAGIALGSGGAALGVLWIIALAAFD